MVTRSLDGLGSYKEDHEGRAGWMKGRLSQQLSLTLHCPLCNPTSSLASSSRALTTSSRRRQSPSNGDSTHDSEDNDTLPPALRKARATVQPHFMRPPLPLGSKGGEPSARPVGRTIPLGMKRLPKTKEKAVPLVHSLGDRGEGPSSGLTGSVTPVREKPSFRRPSDDTIAHRQPEKAERVPTTLPALGTLRNSPGAALHDGAQNEADLPQSAQRAAEPDGNDDPTVADGGADTRHDMLEKAVGNSGEAGIDAASHSHASAGSDRLTGRPSFRWPGGKAPVPASDMHLVQILKDTFRQHPFPEALHALVQLHTQYLTFATTASYHVLLQFCIHTSNLRLFNSLYARMTSEGIPKHAKTWDMVMETYAHNGKWRELVREYEKREHARTPMTKIGWTRIVRAATRNGSTSLRLPEVEVDKEMSPLYGAAYGDPEHLPYGVRQATLQSMLHEVQMDVDRLLAAMMPSDMRPLDFHATVVVGQRLAKQRRWREAYDVIGDWLDRASQDLRARRATQVETSSEATSTAHEADTSLTKHRQLIQRRARTLLHVLIEGLVISRTDPLTLRSFIDSILEQHATTISIQPNYHTIYLLLTSFRAEPIQRKFRDARLAFEQAQMDFKPDLSSPEAQESLKLCLMRLESHAKWARRPGFREKYPELAKETTESFEQIRQDIEALLDSTNTEGRDHVPRQRLDPSLMESSRPRRVFRKPNRPAQHFRNDNSKL